MQASNNFSDYHDMTVCSLELILCAYMHCIIFCSTGNDQLTVDETESIIVRMRLHVINMCTCSAHSINHLASYGSSQKGLR